MLFNENLTIWILLTVLVIAVVSSVYYQSYAKYDASAYHIFISIVTGLGIFISFLFYYNVISNQMKQNEIIASQEINKINRSLQVLLNEVDKSSTLIPAFISSLMGVNIDSGITDPETLEAEIRKLNLSRNIFSIWQESLFQTFPDVNDRMYLKTFIQQAKSKQLFLYWEDNKLNYNKETQIFGNLLFEYANSGKDAKTLMSDKRYLDILHSNSEKIKNL